jgi:NADH-quinone oxidoreductase subunit J
VELRDLIFLAFGFVAVASGMIVALAPRIIHAVFALLFTFAGVAGLYVLLQADFVAASQIMVYVGGILVLLLFGVMLTHRVTNVDLKAAAVQRVPAAIFCAGILGVLIVMIHTTPWPVAESVAWAPTAKRLGIHIMTDYLLPFEVISILLLGVLMGAALLARAEKKT